MPVSINFQAGQVLNHAIYFPIMVGFPHYRLLHSQHCENSRLTLCAWCLAAAAVVVAAAAAAAAPNRYVC